MRITRNEDEPGSMSATNGAMILGVCPQGTHIVADIPNELVLIFEDGSTFSRVLRPREYQVFQNIFHGKMPRAGE